jgi:riboflavin synthase
MFTGIIESTAIVKEVIFNGSNRTFWLNCPLGREFRADQSVSHSGVCLTVEETRDTLYRVTAIEETLLKTTIGAWETGTIVNIERSLLLGSRLDGHFVQGHVDTTGACLMRTEKKGSWEFDFEFPSSFSSLMIEKGSICINGISLTAFNVKRNSFRVAIIPYTFEHTNISQVLKGEKVNLEFDMIGKYIDRRLSLL